MSAEDPSPLPPALARLRASGPFPPDADELMLYGRLVGSWDVDWAAIDPAGRAVERQRGEWRFGWILGGRAIQDVIWPAGAPSDRDGTTIRCWDARLNAWRVVFMSPSDGQFVTMLGRREHDRIVQDVINPPPGVVERWIFSEITDDSFRWHAERSHDEGRTWATTHEMRVRRQRP